MGEDARRDGEPAGVDQVYQYLTGQDAKDSRDRFCQALSQELAGTASWLTFDSFLGAGDTSMPGDWEVEGGGPTRRASFVAASVVAETAAALVCGTTQLLDAEQSYCGAALLRQLIECEYLLRLFAQDFPKAARWLSEVDGPRWGFTPKNLRRLGGFDDGEYWRHCALGGHPHPSGRTLLPVSRAVTGFGRRMFGGINVKELNLEILRLDFCVHVDRTWRALTELLSSEHARFATVRKHSVERVTAARYAWMDSDPLAVRTSMLTLLDTKHG